MLGLKGSGSLDSPLSQRGGLVGGEVREPLDVPPRLDDQMAEVDAAICAGGIGEHVGEDHQLVACDHAVAGPVLVTDVARHVTGHLCPLAASARRWWGR